MSVKVMARGEREVLITRDFAAPRERVWRAMTEAELVKQWLTGPPGWTMTECTIEARVGGRYRYVWENADGRRMGMGGEFREVTPPERLVQTEVFDEAWYPGEAVGTMVLREHAGGTAMELTMVYVSAEARDRILQSGMERGMEFSYQRLDGMLAAA
jgi:uncharacterized protein YndB with AHSA1/START domain